MIILLGCPERAGIKLQTAILANFREHFPWAEALRAGFHLILASAFPVIVGFISISST